MQIAPVALSSVAVATRGRFHVVESVKDVIINQIITDSRNYETVHGALFVAFVGIYAIFKVAGQTHLSCYSYDNCLFGAKSYPERLYLYVDETDN